MTRSSSVEAGRRCSSRRRLTAWWTGPTFVGSAPAPSPLPPCRESVGSSPWPGAVDAVVPADSDGFLLSGAPYDPGWTASAGGDRLGHPSLWTPNPPGRCAPMTRPRSPCATRRSEPTSWPCSWRLRLWPSASSCWGSTARTDCLQSHRTPSTRWPCAKRSPTTLSRCDLTNRPRRLDGAGGAGA